MTFDSEQLQQQIPFYLTAEDQKLLLKELEVIAHGGSANYFLSPYTDSFRGEMLQGDGWRGFQLFLFESGERRTVKGVILSNSCDVDPQNTREIPARVIFSPLVKLSAYEALLFESGINLERVEAKINSIKRQKTTNIFYLPAGGPLSEDYVIRFDEAQSMPVAAQIKDPERTKLFTLSNTGFYMLIFKLSVHFCRLQEKISRNPLTA